jgi:acetate CoA/acetoacetate CoA-transferase alpha subunit
MKVVSVENAVAMIPDGAVLMIGGFMAVGTPERVIDELVRQGKKNLTVIANDTAIPGRGIGKLVDKGLVRRAVTSHIGLNPETQKQMLGGKMAVDLVPQGTLIERIRAAGSGLGGILTPTGVGTIVEEGKQKIDVNGKSYLVETALRADFALVSAFLADYLGNLSYALTARHFNPELTGEGLELVEIAPGIDVERDILAKMEFRPIIRRDPAVMDKRIFLPEAMGLRDDLLRMPLEQRFTYHPEKNQFFVNFEGHVVRSQQDIERIRRIVETMLSSARRKVHVIVNYDNFSIYPDIIDEYSVMVRDLADRFYSGATRYSTSGFLRTKLGDALSRRELAPHIYENAEEASAHLHELENKVAS